MTSITVLYHSLRQMISIETLSSVGQGNCIHKALIFQPAGCFLVKTVTWWPLVACSHVVQVKSFEEPVVN